MEKGLPHERDDELPSQSQELEDILDVCEDFRRICAAECIGMSGSWKDKMNLLHEKPMKRFRASTLEEVREACNFWLQHNPRVRVLALMLSRDTSPLYDRELLETPRSQWPDWALKQYGEPVDAFKNMGGRPTVQPNPEIIFFYEETKAGDPVVLMTLERKGDGTSTSLNGKDARARAVREYTAWLGKHSDEYECPLRFHGPGESAFLVKRKHGT